MEAHNDAERAVLSGYAEGKQVVLEDNPSALRQVRGEFLAWLLTDGGTVRTKLSRLNVNGAQVIGKFDLAGRTIDQPIVLHNVTFEQPPDLTEARLSGLRLTGSSCPGLTAAAARIDGNAYFDDGFTSRSLTSRRQARQHHAQPPRCRR